jgi:pyruvate/2-oxoglutarate/acetoin dehydrogenase E1 component
MADQHRLEAAPLDLDLGQLGHSSDRLISWPLRTGRHLTLVGWGSAVETALQAADELSEGGIDADVIDLFSLAPLDSRSLGDRLRETGRLIVASDDPFAARVLDVARREAFEFIEAPPHACTVDVAELIRSAQDSIAF